MDLIEKRAAFANQGSLLTAVKFTEAEPRVSSGRARA